jgi:hypothetical protein
VRAARRGAHAPAEVPEIADENGGNRFSGLPGYDESVQYVLRSLRGAGYRPTVQQFDYLAWTQLGPSAFEQTAPVPTTYVEHEDFELLQQTDAGDVTAAVTPVDLQLGLGTRQPADVRRPTSPGSRPATSRSSSGARARSRSRRRTPPPSARSASSS